MEYFQQLVLYLIQVQLLLFLYIFGDNIEDALGSFTYLVFYLLSGVFAGLVHTFLENASGIPTIGASGAIAGVLGAYLVLFPQGKVSVLVGQSVSQVSALIVIGLWIVLQFFSGIGSIANTADTGGVAYMAHIGGFIAGFVLTFVLRGSRGVSAKS
jgi:membrane associated rhomboid family serine protease